MINYSFDNLLKIKLLSLLVLMNEEQKISNIKLYIFYIGCCKLVVKSIICSTNLVIYICYWVAAFNVIIYFYTSKIKSIIIDDNKLFLCKFFYFIIIVDDFLKKLFVHLHLILLFRFIHFLLAFLKEVLQFLDNFFLVLHQWLFYKWFLLKFHKWL